MEVENIKSADELIDRLFMTLLQNMVYALDQHQDEWNNAIKKVSVEKNLKVMERGKKNRSF